MVKVETNIRDRHEFMYGKAIGQGNLKISGMVISAIAFEDVSNSQIRWDDLHLPVATKLYFRHYDDGESVQNRIFVCHFL